MATREADLDLGGGDKKKVRRKKALLMYDGAALARVAAKPAPTVANKANRQAAAHA